MVFFRRMEIESSKSASKRGQEKNDGPGVEQRDMVELGGIGAEAFYKGPLRGWKEKEGRYIRGV